MSHFFLKQRVRPGDFALDATCGNGLDTLLLVELVREGGRVWAFDIQSRAIAATRQLLEREWCLSSVELVESGHETLSKHVPYGLSAAVFNLGYLPGGDSSLITSPESTVSALEQAAKRLKQGGIITISVYTGHPGGPEEARAVEEWGASLSPNNFNVWCNRQMNRPAIAPYLILVERI
jgi:SAM-dependent methyltransferase